MNEEKNDVTEKKDGKNGSSKPAWILGFIAIAISLIGVIILLATAQKIKSDVTDGITQIQTATQKSLSDIDAKTKDGIEAVKSAKPAVAPKVETKTVEAETETSLGKLKMDSSVKKANNGRRVKK